MLSPLFVASVPILVYERRTPTKGGSGARYRIVRTGSALIFCGKRGLYVGYGSKEILPGENSMRKDGWLPKHQLGCSVHEVRELLADNPVNETRTRPCSRCHKVFTTRHKCRFLCDRCHDYVSSMGWF